MKRSRKIITLKVLFLVIGTTLFSCSSNVDDKYINLTSRYVEIEQEINQKFEILKESCDEEDFKLGQMHIDFSIPKDKISKRATNDLYEGYRHRIFKNVFVTTDKVVIFELKTCLNKQCNSDKTTGDYRHYLSKEKLSFGKNEKVVEQKEINGLIYYIVKM